MTAANPTPDISPRRAPRGPTGQAVSRAHRAAAVFSRGVQILAGVLSAIPGVAALYVVGRRAVADNAVTTMDWAFFALGATLLLIGVALVLNGHFWRTAGRLARVADGIWGRVRRGRRA